MERFTERVARLPRLGVGLSTEFGAGRVGVDPVALRADHPGLVDFLEVGADVERGVDDDTRAWVRRGWPTTYHFLDLNLEEPEDLDAPWLDATLALARGVGAAWLCGDAGLWHVGPRDRGHGTLLPPILCAHSARTMADTVRRLRELGGFEVLPENPPAQVLVGDLHLLEYFGALAEWADCGLLLDVAHLAIVQRAAGLRPTSLLDAFPVERVVELHVAGGREFPAAGRRLIRDDHGPAIHADTWEILDALLPRASALRAVVVECERNTPAEVVPLLEHVRQRVATAPGWRAPPREPPRPHLPDGPPVDHRRAQRTLFRMLLDPAFAEHVRRDGAPNLAEPAASWLRALDPALLAADPDDQRLHQLLGNVATELLHAVRAAPDFLAGFVGSPEFHRALASDAPLVLALADHAERVLPPGPWRALLRLDRAMAEVRRAPPLASPPPAPILAPSARLLDLPSGTVAAAAALRDGRPAPPLGDSLEHALVRRAPSGAVEVEIVNDAIADLLSAAPLTEAVLSAFATRHDADRDDVDSLVASLADDGALAR